MVEETYKGDIGTMRVVLIGPIYPYRGGIAHYTTMLHRALRDCGHDVLMVSFKRQYPSWMYPGRSDKDPSKKPLIVEDAHYWIDSLNPITWLTTFWRIWRYNPDLMILQWWTTFLAPAWFVLGLLNFIFMRKPLIYICHNVLPHEKHWLDPILTKITLRWGSGFIAQSETDKEKLNLLISKEGIVFPHPVYDMFASERLSKEEARIKLRLPLHTPVLLFFGIVREYKGLKEVLRVLPVIRERVGKVILVIAGEFWEDKRIYLNIIDTLKIRDLVIIEDRYIPNEELTFYFSAADFVVAVYREPGRSGVAQMAAGFGVPVIYTMQQLISCFDFCNIQEQDADLLEYNGNIESISCENAQPSQNSWKDLVGRIEELVARRYEKC